MSDINICIASDDGYVLYAGVLISSILKRLPTNEHLVVHILDGGISEKNKLNLNKLKKDYDFDIQYYQMNNDEFANCPLTYLSIATYYRLKIGEILKDIPRVLYLDCDMVACGDISELYHYDLNGKIIGVVEDPLSLENVKHLELPSGCFYFNAGMLLIDLDKWRTNNVQDILFNSLEKYADKLRFQDQDLLNIVLCNDTCSLPLRYNSQYFMQKYSENRKEEYIASLKNPLIIHYIMADKPWKLDSLIYRRHYFIKELKQTPWYNEHKMRNFFMSLLRYPALLVRGLRYWVKHPICFCKKKFWKKIKLMLRPLSIHY